MFRVLVVDDSAVLREFLVRILESDAMLKVVGTASNGEEAIQAVIEMDPDIITMDINMPRLNGFEATRRIMETAPRPIVIVTGSWDPREVATSFQAVEAGALAVVPRPPGIGHPNHAAGVKELIGTVKLMAEVKVVRRWARSPRARATSSAPIPTPPSAPPNGKTPARQIKLVAVGASTGGPQALQALLAALPTPFPVPVVIVQHMAAGFIVGFVNWLAQATGRPIHVATDGELLLSGHVYVAPDGVQMGIQTGGKVELALDHTETRLHPSISYLFQSVVDAYDGQAAGVLLTGMGRDGADELKLMRDRGAITFAQDKESAVVHGMPGAAIELNGAVYVLSPAKIAAALGVLVDAQTPRVPDR